MGPVSNEAKGIDDQPIPQPGKHELTPSNWVGDGADKPGQSENKEAEASSDDGKLGHNAFSFSGCRNEHIFICCWVDRKRGGLRQAAYDHMQETTLGAVAEVFAGKPITRLASGSYATNLLGIRNISDSLTTSGNLEPVMVDTVEVKRFGLHRGDLVASVRGSFRVALVNPLHVSAIAGGNTAVIRLRNGVPPHVIAAYLRHPEVTARLMTAFIGSTVPGISLDALKRTPLRLPEQAVLGQLAELVEAAERFQDAGLRAVQARNALAEAFVLRALGEESAR